MDLSGDWRSSDEDTGGQHTPYDQAAKVINSEENQDILSYAEMDISIGLRNQELSRLKPYQWIRIKRGIYRDDLAIVENFIVAQDLVLVKLIPRIDYSNSKIDLPKTQEEFGKRKKNRRPAAKAFDPEAIRAIGGKVTRVGEFIFFEGNRFSLSGYLYKMFTSSAIVTQGVRPLLEELKKFEKVSQEVEWPGVAQLNIQPGLSSEPGKKQIVHYQANDTSNQLVQTLTHPQTKGNQNLLDGCTAAPSIPSGVCAAAAESSARPGLLTTSSIHKDLISSKHLPGIYFTGKGKHSTMLYASNHYERDEVDQKPKIVSSSRPVGPLKWTDLHEKSTFGPLSKLSLDEINVLHVPLKSTVSSHCVPSSLGSRKSAFSALARPFKVPVFWDPGDSPTKYSEKEVKPADLAVAIDKVQFIEGWLTDSHQKIQLTWSDVEDEGPNREKSYSHALAAAFKATLQPNTAPPQSSDGCSMSQNLGSGRTVHRSSQLKREVHVRTYVKKKSAAKCISSFGRNSVMKTSAAAAAVRSTAAATATVTSSSAATSSAEFVAADSSGPITAVPEATPPAPKRPPLHRQPERRETIPRFSLDSDEEDDGGLERYGERPPKLPRIHVDEPTDDIVLTGPSTMPSNLQVSQISHGSTAIEDAKQLKSAVKLGSSIKVVGQLKGITGHVVHVEANEVVVLSHLSTQECVVPLSDLSSNSSLRLQCEEELVTLDSQSSSLSGNPSCGPSQPSMPAPREHGAGTQVTLQHPTKALGKDSSAPTRNMAGVSVGGSLRPALQQLEPTTLHAQSSSTARLSTSRPDAAQVPGSKPPQPLIVSHSLWGGPRQKASQNPPRPQKGGRHQGREKAVGSIREDATPTKFTSQKSTEASKKPQSVAVDIEVEAPLPAKKMHVAKPGGSRDHQVQKTGLQSLAASDNPSSGASQQSKHAPSEQRTLEPTLVLTKLPERIVHYWEAKHDFKEHTRENGNRKENNAHLADDAFFARIRDRQASTQQMFEFLSEKKKQELSRSEKAVLLEENRLRSLEKYILEDGYNKCISATKKGLFLDGVRNRFRQNTYLRVPINAYNLLYKHYFH